MAQEVDCQVAPLMMELDWIWRGPDPPRFESFKRKDKRNLATHRIVGDRYQGKSALGEFIMSKYLGNGSTCYDFFAANDNESLAWLNPASPFKDNVTLVHGDSVKITSNYQTLKMSQLDPTRTKGDQLFITCKKFYSSEKEHYEGLFNFTSKVVERDSWDRIDVLFIREAQQYISSRMKTNQARTQKEAAEKFIEFHNEAFHSGMTCIIDSQREVEVSKNLRELGTYTYYKNMGAMEIPRKIWWLGHPKLAHFDLDSLRTIDESQFLLMTNKNCAARGRFDEPPWHIDRGSGLLKLLDITITTLDGKHIQTSQFSEARAGRKSVISQDAERMIHILHRDGRTATEILIELGRLKLLPDPRPSVRTIEKHIKAEEIRKEIEGQ